MVWSMITLFTNGWGLLFGGPKDGTLSNAARNECLALLTQNEITGRGLTRTTDDSPIKHMFLDRASMINGIPHASNKHKADVQSLLCMDYLSSQNGSLLVTSVPNIPNLSDHTFSNSQKLPSVDKICCHTLSWYLFQGQYVLP